MTKWYYFMPLAIKEEMINMLYMDKNNNVPKKTGTEQNSIVMSEPPSTLGLLAKAVFKSDHYRLGDTLPSLSVCLETLKINPEHLLAYRQLCGFKSDRVPATYIHMLAFPLFLKILTHQNFPMKAMGQVHLRNQIAVHKEIGLQDTISMQGKVTTTELTAKGVEWNVHVDAEVHGETVWSSQSTFLYRCKTGLKKEPIKECKPEGKSSHWSIPSNIGRRYARISGDYNPIHLSAVTAKFFGFKCAIAHGMWSKGRCLAALDERLPNSGYNIDVNFHRPLFLPNSARFHEQFSSDKHTFSLFNDAGSQMHLQGLITLKQDA
jgi:hypothetical protein